MPDILNTTAADLATGDRLLRLGGIGFAQFSDPNAPAVLVADVRLPNEQADTAAEDPIVEITTSTGTLYTRSTAPAAVVRAASLTPASLLLISRRASLHARLTELGTHLIRRTPVTDDRTAPTVTALEWEQAPLIVIDGHLSQQTIRAMWGRGDLHDRTQIVMVGTDPDDARVYGRQSAAHARMLGILPYDTEGLASLFRTAADPDPTDLPYPGILTA